MAACKHPFPPSRIRRSAVPLRQLDISAQNGSQDKSLDSIHLSSPTDPWAWPWRLGRILLPAGAMEASASAHVADEAKRHLQDCSRVAVFDGKGAVLYANCKVRLCSLA